MDTRIINHERVFYYNSNMQRHRIKGLALINFNGVVIWHMKDALHRVGKPSAYGPNGHIEFWELNVFKRSVRDND